MKTTIEQGVEEEIIRLHGELQSLATNAFGRAIRIGELLCKLKAKLGHGGWLPWLQTNAPFSERTAQNYMRVFQKQTRLKSANIADLTRAYLELDNRSVRSSQRSAESVILSALPQRFREDLESPKSPDVEELKRVYQDRLSFAEELRRRGNPCWTLNELTEDLGLLRAFRAIDAAYGFAGTIRFLSGANGFDREDVIYLASLGREKMRELFHMIADKFWRGKFCIDFLDEAPTKDMTIDEIQDRCLATEEKRIMVTIDGFVHICELEESDRSEWEAAFYPGDLSKIPTRFSTIEELHAACMVTKEKCLCGYIGSFNHRCELMREGSRTHQSVFQDFHTTKLQEFVCTVTDSGDIRMMRVRGLRQPAE